MTARGRVRVGWGMFAAALAGLAAYMASVGWNQANLIAGVAGFFVAAVGLALALAERRQPTAPQGPGHFDLRIDKARAGRDIGQEADVASGDDVSAHMARVSAREGSVLQRIRALAQPPAGRARRGGNG